MAGPMREALQQASAAIDGLLDGIERLKEGGPTSEGLLRIAVADARGVKLTIRKLLANKPKGKTN